MGPSKREDGFSLIEAVVATAVALTVVSTVAVAMKASHDATRVMQQQETEAQTAHRIIDVLFRIPVGEPSDAPASAAERTELFDGDDVLGTATLYSLRHAPTAEGHRFQFADFPLTGEWEVRITADLDGNGDTAGPDEVFDDLLRIDVSFDGRVVLQSARGQVMG